MGFYADEDGKVNRLPGAYDGDFDLPTGKGERLIILHFSKLYLNGILIEFRIIWKGMVVGSANGIYDRSITLERYLYC